MDRLKSSGLSNCKYWESRTLYFWTGTLKIWYPCVLDSFNLDLSGNTAWDQVIVPPPNEFQLYILLEIDIFLRSLLYKAWTIILHCLPPATPWTYLHNFIYLYSDFSSICFLTVWLLDVWWSWSYSRNSEYKNCRVEKKRKEQFSESVHCYSPPPPIGRRRPKIFVIE